MTRLLYIQPGPVPPGDDASRNQFGWLSKIAEGDVLLPIWSNSPDRVPPHLRSTFPIYRVGNFRYHFFLAYRAPRFWRWFAVFLFYIRRGWQLHRERQFDAIVAYGTNRTGIAAMILKWLTGAKMIVEIPGVPENAFRYDAPNPGISSTIKRFVANGHLNLVGISADCIKLLYPTQLHSYPKLAKKKVAIFHNFVLANTSHGEPCDEVFVLSAGYPWYTKGMDVVIRAFRLIAPQFPECKLKLLGFFPDRTHLDKLASGCSQIEFLPASPHDKALKVIGACSVYVLASRTEAMGRVLLEAMAARKPIIAAAVGGVPHYVEDNDNGLLFEPGNIEDLASKLTILLRSDTLRARLGRAGYKRVMSNLDERGYVRSFRQMLQSVGFHLEPQPYVCDGIDTEEGKGKASDI